MTPFPPVLGSATLAVVTVGGKSLRKLELHWTVHNLIASCSRIVQCLDPVVIVRSRGGGRTTGAHGALHFFIYSLAARGNASLSPLIFSCRQLGVGALLPEVHASTQV